MANGLHNKVVLFRAGPVTIVNFGLFAALGAMLATWWAVARQYQVGLEPQRYAAVMYMVLPVLVVLGSRLLVLFTEWGDFVRHPIRVLRQAGFSFQGGLILGLAGLVAITFHYGLDLLKLMDTFALALPLGHTLGRLGCYTYGCCHGRRTGSRCHVVYTNPDSKAVRVSDLAGQPLHPTQLYSAIGNLAIFLVLNWIASSGVRVGALSACYLLIDSGGRFLVERIRWPFGPTWFDLSLFQYVAGAMFIAGVALIPVAVNQPFLAFSDLWPALRAAAGHWPSWTTVFVVFFLCFGIHGRKVGAL